MRAVPNNLDPTLKLLLALHETGELAAGCNSVWLRRNLQGLTSRQIYLLAGKLIREGLVQKRVRTLSWEDGSLKRTQYSLTPKGKKVAAGLASELMKDIPIVTFKPSNSNPIKVTYNFVISEAAEVNS